MVPTATNLGAAFITVTPRMEGTAAAIKTSLGGVDASSAGKAVGASLSGGIADSVKSVAWGSIIAGAVQGVASSVSGFASGIVQAGSDFDAAMSSVQALSGATAADMERLEATAKQMGSTTKFSATESADALGFMALAGWDTEQSIAGLPGILDLAAASNMGLADASDMVTDYLSAFSMEAGQAGEMADMMAYAQANSNTTTAALGEAFKNCAPNMNAAGQSMQTTTSLLAKMANQGLKGSEAGTALTATMRDLTSKMKDGAVNIAGTSIAVMDAEGNYRSMVDIIADVDAATQGMGDAQKAAALSTVFTADSIKGMNMLLNGGVQDLYDFDAALGGCAGSASEMAATMQDNLQGALTTASSAFEGLQLAIFNGVEPGLTSIVSSVASGVLPALTDLVSGTEGAGEALTAAATDTIGQVVAMIADNGPAAVDMLVQVVTSMVEAVIANLPAFLEAGVQLVIQLAQAVSVALPDIISALVGILPSLLESVISMLPDLLAAGIQLFLALVDSIGQALPQIVTAIIGCIPSLTSAVISMAPQLLGAGLQLFISLVSSVAQALPQIIAAVVNLGMQMVAKIPEFGAQMADAGFNLLMGLAEGIGRAVGNVISAVTDAVGSVVSTVTGLFGIHSPSTLFAYYGDMDMRGLGVGFTRSAAETARTVGRAMGEVADAARMDPVEVEVDATVGRSVARGKVDALPQPDPYGQSVKPVERGDTYNISFRDKDLDGDPELREALRTVARAARRRRDQGAYVYGY